MHIPRLSNSQRSPSKDPGNVVGVGVGVSIAPKPSRRIRDFFRFERSHSQATPQADSSGAISVGPSCLPSMNPGTSKQDDQVVPEASARPPCHSPQSATSLVELNTTQKLDPNGSVTPPAIPLTPPSQTADSALRQPQNSSVLPQPSPAVVSQQPLLSPGPTIPPRQHSPQPHDGNSNQLHASQNIQMSHELRDVTIDGTNSDVHDTIPNSNKFLAELLDQTIHGAAFDSSDRDPPPRCHPGTRLAILDRCLMFIVNRVRQKNMLWVVGRAGVGKSALMQNIAESPLPSVFERTSIFLSVNGRNDGTKLILTLVYQLATKCEPYRRLIEYEIARDPSLLTSSMPVQFKKFLTEPFILHPQLKSLGCVLVIIDGLDECDKPLTQQELLRLICDVCLIYDSSPFVWVIASRPEAHITSFFEQDHVKVVHEIEEILVDSDEAHRDAEIFLRAGLTKIQQQFSPSPRSQWPSEQDVWKLVSASGGLFAFAQTVVKYIGDPEFGDPISQLKDVLAVIDAHPLFGIPREQRPLALLDALYARILSKVPQRTMVNTRKILLALVLDSGRDPKFRKGGFLALCNWLGMTYDEAYAAIRHLGSALSTPKRDEAHEEKLRPFHKSFIDYLSDFTRSGFSSDIRHEAQQLEDQYTIRILEQAPGGIDCGGLNNELFDSSGDILGFLACVPDAGSDVMLTWSADGDSYWSDKRTRLEVYKWALVNVLDGIRHGRSVFCAEFYIRMVASRLSSVSETFFPYQELRNLVFENSRRRAFIQSGLLKTVPIKEFDFGGMTWHTTLRFRRSSRITTKLSDPWNPSCQHQRAGDWGASKNQDWTTNFDMSHFGCHFCRRRLEQHLESLKTQPSDHNVTFLLTSFEESFVEFQYIDPSDGVSEWTYWITLAVPKRKRRKI